MKRWFRASVVPLVLLLAATAGYLPGFVTASGETSALKLVSHETVSVMPMGDSITGSTGCWRSLLWTQLRGSADRAVDFAGKGIGPRCDSDYDDDAVAYSGTRVVDMSPKDKFTKALNDTASEATIALVHLGSNDIRDDKSINEILDGYTTVVGLLRKANPDVTILVAQLIPITTSPMDENCPQCPGKVSRLNAKIPEWAAAMGTERSPIPVVDQYEDFDPEADTYDGLHPDDSGSRKMADKWFHAIENILDQLCGCPQTLGPSA